MASAAASTAPVAEEVARGPAGPTQLSGRVIVVTGANTGIGKAVATEFYARGAHVILACRNAERAETAIADIRKSTAATGAGGDTAEDDAGKARVEYMHLDLASFASIRAFVSAFLSRALPLHGLVNNAGLNSGGDNYYARTQDGLNLVFGVNYVGAFLLTTLLLPLLKASAPSRIVNLSSVTHRYADGSFEVSARSAASGNYGNSKLACTMMTYQLQHMLEQEGVMGVKVFAANPGGVLSDIWRTLPAFVHCAAMPLAKCLLLTTQQGAATTVDAMTNSELEGGEYLVPYRLPGCCNHMFEWVQPFAGPRVARSSPLSYDRRAQRSLWDFTARLIEDVDNKRANNAYAHPPTAAPTKPDPVPTAL